MSSDDDVPAPSPSAAVLARRASREAKSMREESGSEEDCDEPVEWEDQCHGSEAGPLALFRPAHVQRGIHYHIPGIGRSLVEEADFIASPRPGLTPDDLTRGREVGEGLQGFQPKKFRWAKSKERPLSGDRSFNPCLTA